MPTKKKPVAKPKVSSVEEDSAFELIVPSYKAFMLNIVPFMITVLSIVAIMALAARFQSDFALLYRGERIYDLSDPNSFMLWTLAVAAVSVVAYCMQIHLMLHSARSKKTDIRAALESTSKFLFRTIGLNIILGLAVIAGLILFIIPGLYLIKRYSLAYFFMYDKNLSIRESMKRSAQATKKPHSMLIWGVLGVMVLFIILAAIIGSIFISTPVIGDLVSSTVITMYGIAFAIRYYQIKPTVNFKD